MKRLCAVAVAVIALAGCAREESAPAKGESSVVLRVSWQRLVTEAGGTCDRCGSTEEELGRAVATLGEALAPLDIEVEFAEDALTPEEFGEDTIGSNRILISGRTVEEWLGGEVGHSPCESCCSAIGEDVECRTVTVEGVTYEAVPAKLVVSAGLIAASELLQKPSSGPCCPSSVDASQRKTPCCPSNDDATENKMPCCPGDGE